MSYVVQVVWVAPQKRISKLARRARFGLDEDREHEVSSSISIDMRLRLRSPYGPLTTDSVGSFPYSRWDSTPCQPSHLSPRISSHWSSRRPDIPIRELSNKSRLPKGVMVDNGNLASFVSASSEVFNVGYGSRVLQFAPYALTPRYLSGLLLFSGSIWPMWWARIKLLSFIQHQQPFLPYHRKWHLSRCSRFLLVVKHARRA